MIWGIGLLSTVLFSACTDIQSRQEANRLARMREDDEYCVGQGNRYPDPGYISCRYVLQNARMNRQVKSMQMAHDAGISTPASIQQPAYVREPSAPLDREHFQCWPDPQFGFNYIRCGEKD
jgi:hypothetical protein